ncbi:multidrug resistance efflux transporter family protein [Streptomyces sp. ID38640]|nr:multidrug resistance efflux transporter family protein [Streptomyces sp. ID38640]
MPRSHHRAEQGVDRIPCHGPTGPAPPPSAAPSTSRSPVPAWRAPAGWSPRPGSWLIVAGIGLGALGGGPRCLDAVETTQAAEVPFTLLGEALVVGVAAPALSGRAGHALIVLGPGADAPGQIPGGGDHQQQDDGAEGERLEGEPGDTPDRPEVVRNAEELLQCAGKQRHP